jgi:hypothetical protein
MQKNGKNLGEYCGKNLAHSLIAAADQVMGKIDIRAYRPIASIPLQAAGASSISVNEKIAAH